MAFERNQRVLLLATGIAAGLAAAGVGYAAYHMTPRTRTLEPIATGSISMQEPSCDAYKIRGRDDAREEWERERDARLLGGCTDEMLARIRGGH